MKISRKALCTLFLMALTADANAEGRWPQFRGPGGRGVAEGVDLPSRWSPDQNIAWTQDLPGRGWSSPVVWGNRVYVTTAVNLGESEDPKKGLYFGGDRPEAPDSVHQLMVLAIDLETGMIVWRQIVHEGVPKTAIHLKNSFASETPATDGQNVYAYFGGVGLFCLDRDDGNVRWSHPFPAHKTRHGWGYAASPVLYDDQVLIVNDNEDDSYFVAINKQSGKETWRVTRDEKSNWCTPFVWKNSLRTEIITLGSNKCRAYDLAGKRLYEFGGHSGIAIATPYADGDLLYVSSGYVLGKRKPIFAVRPGGSGDISLTQGEDESDYIAWCQRSAAPYNPSTIVYDGLLYVLYDMGLFACYDARTGEEIYGKKRLKNGRAFTASPWAYGGNIFCLNEDGVTSVVKAGPEFEVIRTNRLDENSMCMATPAVAGDRLLVRTAKRLY